MVQKVKPQIDKQWLEVLAPAFNSTSFLELEQFLKAEKQAGKTIYPAENEIYNAFNLVPFSQVKCVIIGQDPYHGPGQAHGLCFSVRKGVKPPPSLKNIFKELQNDLGLQIPGHGQLTQWAGQGILMLNAVLTVEYKRPASHKKIGWESFTDYAIQQVSDKLENVVFLLWGKFAQGKKELINSEKHLVLEAAHPSPFSANAGFFGCRHFSKCNKYLQQFGKQPINWQID
ncbi:MAG: uracil-DNA glycosylase [Bacteroidetes bacterium]|nr:uracil-DNA glycosylase [Bacteroidota bacterium]